MVGVGGQKRAGFKTISLRLAQKVASINALREKQNKRVSVVKSYDDNGRRPVIKIVVPTKASEMLSGLKPRLRPYFEELINEIKQNPNAPFADISAKIIRTLKARDSSKYYSNGSILKLYREGVKSGAIKVS